MEIEDIFATAARQMLDEHAGVEQGRIFHAVGLKTAGKFFAFVRKDELVLKLPAARVAELIASGAGQPFDAGRGRPLREWVCLRPANVVACAGYMSEARTFVAG